MLDFKRLCEEVLMCFEETDEGEWELLEWDIEGVEPNEQVFPGRDLQQILDDIQLTLEQDRGEAAIPEDYGFEVIE